MLSQTQINQLEADLQELGSLLEKAERKRVQELLKQEQKKVEKEIAVKRQQKEQQARRQADPAAASKATYTVKITNYGIVSFSNIFSLFSVRLWIRKENKCFKAVNTFSSPTQRGTSQTNLSKFTLHWKMCTKFHQKMWTSTLQKSKLIYNLVQA